MPDCACASAAQRPTFVRLIRLTFVPPLALLVILAGTTALPAFSGNVVVRANNILGATTKTLSFTTQVLSTSTSPVFKGAVSPACVPSATTLLALSPIVQHGNGGEAEMTAACLGSCLRAYALL